MKEFEEILRILKEVKIKTTRNFAV